MELNALRAAFRGLSAYRNLTAQPVLLQMGRLLDALAQGRGEEALDAYTAVFYHLREEGFSGLGDWLWDRLRYTETPYALLAQRGGSDPALENGARRDVDTFVLLAETDCDRCVDAMKELLPNEYAPVLAALPRWRAAAPFDFEALTQFYREHGAGLYARYQAFLWEEGQLVPVPDPDCPRPEDLLGYELQRDQVEANTRQLMAGHPANNVLLFGDGGTGKSATVKSMLYLPGMEDLRLIEIQKENLTGLPQLMRSLGGRRQKFILFIDDLAFDQDDKTYSSLKTILEGSLERRPANVAIYATSNRRHLVRQNFSDRGSDEVDAAETISEKTALAERFGLRIPYLTMNKAGYLALVDHLAGQAGITMDREVLHAQAMTWEIRHSGRTPRVARQFIASLLQ
ncbi:ATP-binding protein [Pseudoflavonifractor phocaeensis]|uniref:ATP-binding protein n=1 Tax=Pseudoflavonifractor phocaeensis TaxID=1870988 RepID=UPI001F1D5957|nr:ATP-binding protein [Pseudoflavonifractor phocaeensis]MCF2596549.1 ATP-binding protein [Pseudoflavonifractor phocaeensis]